MKKRIESVKIGWFFVLVLLAGCAPVSKTIVTTGNLPALKGNWQGWASVGIGQGSGVMTQLIIRSDTVPVQGSVTFRNLPSELARIIPADHKTAGNDVTFNFSEGKITNNGAVIDQSGQNTLELTYFAGEKPKIQGWFYYWTFKGTFEVTKQ